MYQTQLEYTYGEKENCDDELIQFIRKYKR